MQPARAARPYPFREPAALALEPQYAHLQEHEPLSRISLPYGGDAWLAVRHEDVRTVLNDPLVSAAFSPRQIGRLAAYAQRVTDERLDAVEEQGPPAGLVAARRREPSDDLGSPASRWRTSTWAAYGCGPGTR